MLPANILSRSSPGGHQLVSPSKLANGTKSKGIRYSYNPTFRHTNRKQRGVGLMVRVSVEVRSGSARFRVSVRAQSIRQAASIVSSWYPDGEVKVKFPIDPAG